MLRLPLVFQVLFLTIAPLMMSVPARSQLAGGATETPAPSTGDEPTRNRSFSTAEIVPEIVAAEREVALIQDRLKSDQELPAIAKMIRDQDVIINQLRDYLAEHPVASMTPGRFRETRSSLLRFRSQLNRWQETLQKRITQLDNSEESLSQMSRIWHRTRQEANARATPNTLLRQIDALLADIQEVEDETLNRMGGLIELQSLVGKRLIQISSQLEDMQNVEVRVRDALLGFDHPPLWSLSRSPRHLVSIRAEFSDLLRIEASELRVYWQTSGDAIKRQILFFVLLSVFLVVLHRRRARRMTLAGETTAMTHLISKPVTAAMLIALLTTRWWQPEAPQSIRELSMFLTIFPVPYLLVGLLGRRLMIAVLNIQVQIVLNTVRSATLAGSPLDRIILAIMGVLSLFVLIQFLRAQSSDFESLDVQPGPLSRFLMKIGMALSAVAVLLGVFGNINLSEIFTRGVFVGVVLMVWLPLAFQVLKAIFKFILTSNLAMSFRTVQSHGGLIFTRIAFGLRILVIGLWVYYVVRNFSADWIWSVLWQGLQWQLKIGSLNLSPTKIVLFLSMLWATVLLARFVRFVLQQEVLSRLSLERGIPSAISRLVHYALIGVGVVIAASAAGLSFSQFAIITGALSVGIGFGLQNIVNNFVSGLILMVERPVDIGDTVELGTLIGRVRTIGLRSSVVRTTTGAEVIVPNAHFIANEVINWTLSDQHRRIEIPVGVAYGTDPHRVIDVLMAAAKDQVGVLAVPEPVVLFDGFGDSSLDFQLRFWTPEFQGWRTIRSTIALAIHDELQKAGIEIPFPQRDLHVRSLDDDTRRALTSSPPIQTPPSE